MKTIEGIGQFNDFSSLSLSTAVENENDQPSPILNAQIQKDNHCLSSILEPIR